MTAGNMQVCAAFLLHQEGLRRGLGASRQAGSAPVKNCGNFTGRITASFSESLAPSKPATSSHCRSMPCITRCTGKTTVAFSYFRYITCSRPPGKACGWLQNCSAPLRSAAPP